MKINKHLIQILIAVAATIPGIVINLVHVELSPPMMATVSGIAILGASFLVLWACDVVQLDVSQTLALALVALIAVLPEYAVDMYFTWMAGQEFPGESEYAHYAIANMTGANRLLIGVGWPVIVIIAWVKLRKNVILEKERSSELFFLAMATLYAFIIPVKGTLAWYDGIVFIGIFIWYLIIASRRPCSECELEGPAEYIGALSKIPRRFTTTAIFLFAAFAIFFNAEHFSEGLIGTGKMFGFNEFYLVQWLAPLASEAPEFIVAIMFALRGQGGMALGALLSSKLNQWTLLVGMIPGVYGLSSKQLAQPIPMDVLQMHEILLTAAQSLLGVMLLSAFVVKRWHAVVLLTLFLGQFFMSPLFDTLAEKGYNVISGDTIHMIFSGIYIIIAVVIIILQPRRVKVMLEGMKLEPDECDITCEVTPPAPLLTANPDLKAVPDAVRLDVGTKKKDSDTCTDPDKNIPEK